MQSKWSLGTGEMVLGDGIRIPSTSRSARLYSTL